MGEIKYVQLESGGFLSDPDFQLMTDAERGIYTSIIFYMYDNDGKILDDPERIKRLTNCEEDFEKKWETVRKKFIKKDGYLAHKRVRKELAKAKRYFQTQRHAGLKGAEKRWGRHNDPNRVAMPEPMAIKVKESKVKVSKDKYKEFVLLTSKEHQKLIDRYGVNVVRTLIDDLNTYIGKIGEKKATKKYDSHYFVLLDFARRDNIPQIQKPKPAKPEPPKPEIKVATAEQRAKIFQAAKGILKKVPFNADRGRPFQDKKQAEINKII